MSSAGRLFTRFDEFSSWVDDEQTEKSNRRVDAIAAETGAAPVVLEERRLKRAAEKAVPGMAVTTLRLELHRDSAYLVVKFNLPRRMDRADKAALQKELGNLCKPLEVNSVIYHTSMGQAQGITLHPSGLIKLDIQ
jgi:hypothetical protein